MTLGTPALPVVRLWIDFGARVVHLQSMQVNL